MNKHARAITYVSWALYLIGTALVLGNYIGLVPSDIAWSGWLVGMISWGIQFIGRKQK